MALTTAQLILDLSARGVDLVISPDEKKLGYRSLDRVAPEIIAVIKNHKPALLAMLRGEEVSELAGYDLAEFEITPMFPDESDAANEFYWANISDSDHDYLTGPRNYSAPCPWCGGRYRHSRLCDELRASWEPVLPFGMHKGKPLSDVPRDYLEWLASCSAGISDELCESIKIRLQGGHSMTGLEEAQPRPPPGSGW